MIFGIRWIAFLLAISVSPTTMMAGESVQPFAAKSRVDNVGTAYTPDGKVIVQIREIHTEAVGRKGTKHLGVLALFEPVSGAFSWRVTDTDSIDTSWDTKKFKDRQAAYVKDGEIIDFRALWPRLLIRSYSGHASSLDDAEAKALKFASECVATTVSLSSAEPYALSPISRLDKSQGVREVWLSALDIDFVAPPMSVVIPHDNMEPRVTDVRWDGDKQHWIVALQARWTEEITLDADYNLVSMKKVK